MSLYTLGLSKSAALRVAITLATALLGAALLPGLMSAPSARASLLWDLASTTTAQQA